MMVVSSCSCIALAIFERIVWMNFQAKMCVFTILQCIHAWQSLLITLLLHNKQQRSCHLLQDAASSLETSPCFVYATFLPFLWSRFGHRSCSTLYIETGFGERSKYSSLDGTNTNHRGSDVQWSKNTICFLSAKESELFYLILISCLMPDWCLLCSALTVTKYLRAYVCCVLLFYVTVCEFGGVCWGCIETEHWCACSDCILRSSATEKINVLYKLHRLHLCSIMDVVLSRSSSRGQYVIRAPPPFTALLLSHRCF